MRITLIDVAFQNITKFVKDQYTYDTNFHKLPVMLFRVIFINTSFDNTSYLQMLHLVTSNYNGNVH